MDRDKARGITDEIEVRAPRDGGPSMKVPGRGGVWRAPQLEQGGRDEQSAVHHADAMQPWGGPADE